MLNQQSVLAGKTMQRSTSWPILQFMIVALLLPMSAQAASFTVTRFDDPVPYAGYCTSTPPVYCSLASAILAANQANRAQWHTIHLKKGHYKLTRSLPPITGSVIIQGLGPEDTLVLGGCGMSVDREPETGHCSGAQFRIFEIAPGGAAQFHEMTIRGGFGPDGAGILSRGTLHLQHVTVMGNVAHQGAGGIRNDGGHLVLVNSTVRENSSHHGPAGGIVNGRIFQDPKARGKHTNEPISLLEIHSSTISGNQSHAGDFKYDGYAGGIINGGLLGIDNSTISGNRVRYSDSTEAAGGILNLGQGDASWTHLGEAWLKSVTITANEAPSTAAGGVENVAGKFHFGNTIIAGNETNDCFGELMSLRGNLVDELGYGSGKVPCQIKDWAGLPNVKPTDRIGRSDGVPLHWNTLPILTGPTPRTLAPPFSPTMAGLHVPLPCARPTPTVVSIPRPAWRAIRAGTAHRAHTTWPVRRPISAEPSGTDATAVRLSSLPTGHQAANSNARG
jgi:hypothetical protein